MQKFKKNWIDSDLKYFDFSLLENEVQWTNSSNVSSPSRKLRLYPGGNQLYKNCCTYTKKWKT